MENVRWLRHYGSNQLFRPTTVFTSLSHSCIIVIVLLRRFLSVSLQILFKLTINLFIKMKVSKIVLAIAFYSVGIAALPTRFHCATECGDKTGVNLHFKRSSDSNGSAGAATVYTCSKCYGYHSKNQDNVIAHQAACDGNSTLILAKRLAEGLTCFKKYTNEKLQNKLPVIMTLGWSNFEAD